MEVSATFVAITICLQFGGGLEKARVWASCPSLAYRGTITASSLTPPSSSRGASPGPVRVPGSSSRSESDSSPPLWPSSPPPSPSTSEESDSSLEKSSAASPSKGSNSLSRRPDSAGAAASPLHKFRRSLLAKYITSRCPVTKARIPPFGSFLWIAAIFL